MPVELGRRGLVVQRAHRGLRLERIAKPDPGLGSRYHPLDELAADGGMDEEPLAGRAALAGAQIGRLQRRLGRQFQVGVRQHHHRAVAAEFQ